MSGRRMTCCEAGTGTATRRGPTRRTRMPFGCGHTSRSLSQFSSNPSIPGLLLPRLWSRPRSPRCLQQLSKRRMSLMISRIWQRAPPCMLRCRREAAGGRAASSSSPCPTACGARARADAQDPAAGALPRWATSTDADPRRTVGPLDRRSCRGRRRPQPFWAAVQDYFGCSGAVATTSASYSLQRTQQQRLQLRKLCQCSKFTFSEAGGPCSDHSAPHAK
mmetsp:Transcript_166872/g.530580  ORF Transcript_166872/g.530580 Transcript_166872/m.530580 type:complete len:220 (-) Transcript_166872:137-796(-)